MAQTALKEEFEKIFVDAPPAPTFPTLHANDNGFDIARAFEKTCDKFERDAIIWRSKMLSDLDGLQSSLANEDFSVETLRAEVIPTLEGFRARLDVMLDDVVSGTPEMNNFWAVLTMLGETNSKWRVPAKKMRKSFSQTRDAYHRGITAVRERLLQVIWKHDPDSESGEAFENAEDAIAFLRG